MFGVTPDAMFTGGVSLAGGLLSNAWTDDRAEKAQKFNAEQAQINRAWQEKMSNTAYRRAMTDMKYAGLNPILAFSKGGASSPGGATASTSYTEARDVLTPAVSTAMQATRMNEEVKNMKETNNNLQAQNVVLRAQAGHIASQIADTQASTAIKREALHDYQKKAGVADIDKAFYDSSFGKLMRNIGLIGGEFGNILKGAPRPHIRVEKNYGD